jgi:hypothetical protein
MSSSTFTTGVTSALRGFGTGALTQRRALTGAVMRQISTTTAVAASSRGKLERGMRTPAPVVVSQLAFALRATAALLDSQPVNLEIGASRAPAGNFVITDPAKTRC